MSTDMQGAYDADVTVSRDPIALLLRANDEFARRLRLVGAADWRRPTPCSEWDVRALVNHVVGANVQDQLRHRLGRQPHVTEDVP